MGIRVKVRKSLRKLYSYGSSFLLDQSKRDGPTVPMFTCVCPICSREETHTNKEKAHYCDANGFMVHPPERMKWKK